MRLAFIHDHPFYKENDLVYSGGGLPHRIWDNYLGNFEKITVVGRESNHIKDRKVISSRENVEFKLTNNYSSISSLIKNRILITAEINEVINEADIVLARMPSILGVIASIQALKKSKSLWVEQVGHAKDAMNTHGSILGKVIAPFLHQVNRYIVKNANYVTYVTARQLQECYPASKAIASVNLSNVLINRVLSPDEIDNQRFLAKELHIGLIGGFDVKYKGQDVLLDAIGKLSDDIKRNVKVSFVGKGDSNWLISRSKNLNLNNNIKFIGAMEPGEQINELLRSVSLYVQPSLTEGMPRATIEAMAMGCPVIGSDVGGIPELVSNNYVHRRGNADELSRHIKSLYLNRSLLLNESRLSLEKAIDYKKDNLEVRRNKFYAKMNDFEND